MRCRHPPGVCASDPVSPPPVRHNSRCVAPHFCVTRAIASHDRNVTRRVCRGFPVTTTQRRLLFVGHPDAAEVSQWTSVRDLASQLGWETTRRFSPGFRHHRDRDRRCAGWRLYPPLGGVDPARRHRIVDPPLHARGRRARPAVRQQRHLRISLLIPPRRFPQLCRTGRTWCLPLAEAPGVVSTRDGSPPDRDGARRILTNSDVSCSRLDAAGIPISGWAIRPSGNLTAFEAEQKRRIQGTSALGSRLPEPHEIALGVPEVGRETHRAHG